MLPDNFRIEVFYEGLTTPINLVIVNQQEMLIADAGIADGNGKVLGLRSGQLHTIADGFHPPLTGITFHQGSIYVAHRGSITVIRPDGKMQHSNHEHHHHL